MLGDLTDAFLAVLEKIDHGHPQRMRDRLGNRRLPLKDQSLLVVDHHGTPTM
jgi:hypothetical protein